MLPMNPIRRALRFAPAASAAVLLLAASPATDEKTAKAPEAPAAEVGGSARARTLEVSGIDGSTPACEDFYQHGNGAWLAKHPIPADRPRWGSFDELRQRNLDDLHGILDRLAADRTAAAGTDERRLGDFYAACMDEAGVERKGLEPLAGELGKIDAIHDAASLRAEIVRLQSLGVNALFAFGSEEDRKDASFVVSAALQGGLGLPERDYYEKTDAKSKALRNEYVKHVAKMLELAGSAPTKASADAKKILGLETKLALASQHNADFRDPEKTYHPTSLDALAKANPNLDWKAYFASQELPSDVKINVWEPEFFETADRLVRSEPLATWKVYLRWHLLSAAAPTLSKKFEDENFAFYGTTLSGIPKIAPRWKRCVNATDNAMGMALGKIYVAEFFPPAAKKRADELVKNLLGALADDLKTLDWMGEATKKAALEKVAAIEPKIGYPDKWRDYSSLAVVRDDYAGSTFAANRFEWRRDLGKIGKPVDRSDWGMSPPTVNAEYRSAKNDIVFPAGIFQPPFFYAEGDDAINYGAIGGVIGHEITHGFDNSGRRFDAKGNQVDWWTPEDSKNFDERAECIIKEFDGFYVEPDLHHNGKLVQGESIADLGGLTIAYRAYRKSLEGKTEPAPIDGFTADQRFFLANARIWASNHRPEFARLLVQTNEHPLGKYRLIGTVTNMPEFAKAFGCKSGNPMVREPRCRIW